MDRPLLRFIDALRMANVRVSTAEMLDAVAAVDVVGYRDRQRLRHTLRLVLPKTADEKLAFDECFEAFFAPPVLGNESQDRGGGDDDASNPSSGAQSGDDNDGGSGHGGDGQQAREAGAADDDTNGPATGPTPASGEDGAQTAAPGTQPQVRSELGKLLLANDRSELSLRLQAAAEAVNLASIQMFTQKGLYSRRILDAMGQQALLEDIRTFEGATEANQRRVGQRLRMGRDRLREQVRDYVEQQFLLHADADGRQLREDLLRRVKLSNVDNRNFKLIQDVVGRMAKKLIALYSRRRKITRRGQLNLPKTLRANMAYDGAIFDLRWKATRVDRPKVFAICDVSGSVASYARFMLMFLYSLEAVMPNVRSFAFSSELAEVTDLFDREPLETAINRTIAEHGGGSTDYGQAFVDFRRLALDDLDNRSTVIILGDGRNNYGDARAEILKEIFERSKRVLWLNPEPPRSWQQGDAEMRRYGAYCHQLAECNSLLHLERVVGQLLRTA
ncbi:MAG: VWA domain-containing protein [Pseudomonadota bacterium]